MKYSRSIYINRIFYDQPLFLHIPPFSIRPSIYFYYYGVFAIDIGCSLDCASRNRITKWPMRTLMERKGEYELEKEAEVEK